MSTMVFKLSPRNAHKTTFMLYILDTLKKCFTLVDGEHQSYFQLKLYARRYNSECLQPSMKHWGGSVMVWFAFQPVVVEIMSKLMEL